MALTLDIPVRTSITLPDNWQDCQTPQQLSYWLIARFEELAKTNDINELKSLVAEVRAYVDTFGGRIDGVETELTTLENFLSDIDNTLTNLVRDVETNTNDITSINLQVDSLHEGIIQNAQQIGALESSDQTQNQKIGVLEGNDRVQNQQIETNRQGLNTLDRALVTLNNTVSTQAEKFAGLVEAQVVNLSTTNNTLTLTDQNQKVFIINCLDNVGTFTVLNNLSDDLATGDSFRFYIFNDYRSEADGAMTANFSQFSDYPEIISCKLSVEWLDSLYLVLSTLEGQEPPPNGIWWSHGIVVDVVVTNNEPNFPSSLFYNVSSIGNKYARNIE